MKKNTHTEKFTYHKCIQHAECSHNEHPHVSSTWINILHFTSNQKPFLMLHRPVITSPKDNPNLTSMAEINFACFCTFKNGIIQYYFVPDFFHSTLVRFLQVVVCNCSLFFFIAMYQSMELLEQFISLLLGYFQFGIIKNNNF